MAWPDDISEWIPYQTRPSAGDFNKVVALLKGMFTGQGFAVDNAGVQFRPSPVGLTPFRWGTLDGSLDAGGTATASLWCSTNGGWEGWDVDSGEDETVYAPPLMASGSLDAGIWVLIGRINGRWVVIGRECP